MRRSLVAPVLMAALALAPAAAMAQAPMSPAESRLGARLQDSATLHGVVIKQIVPDKAADRAGLKAGDLILRFQGQDIQDMAHFASMVMVAPGESELILDALRGTQVEGFEVVLPALAAAEKEEEESSELKEVDARIKALEQELAALKAKRQKLQAQAAGPSRPKAQGLALTIVGNDGQTMVLIPAGEFTMGEEEPKRIYLDAFYIDQYELTNAVWDRVNVSKRRPKSLCDRCPVIDVSWFEAEAYCAKVGKRLPTEFEWEKTARGPDGLPYVWGQQFRPGLANVKSDSDKDQFTAPIGSYSFDKSPYGVFDLAGNVAEWTSSWYERGYYATMPRSNPRGPDRGDFRIYRGGSWESRKEKTQTTSRDWSFPEERYDTVGFRCAVDAR